MKKYLVSILVSLLLMGISGTTWAKDKAEKPANVITVATSGGDFTSISAALASLPTPNTTPTVVKVMPGTYSENINITKSNIDLQGVDPKFATIAGRISISNSSNIVISGLAFTDGGIYFSGSVSDTTINNNHITGDVGGAGIDSYASGNNILIKGNIISVNNANGVSFNGNFTNAVIDGNIIRDTTGSGIYTGSSDAKIINNLVLGNGSPEPSGYGIHCRPNGSNACLVKSNTVTGVSMNGIYVEGSSVIKIVNNIATNNNTSGSPYYADINASATTNTNISFNLYDSIYGIKGINWVGNFNATSDGTPW